MLAYTATLLVIFHLCLIKEISCCASCGCNNPPNYSCGAYEDPGCDDGDSVWDSIPSLQVYPPGAPSGLKEFLPQPPSYSLTPKCGLGNWAPRLPKCLQKPIRQPFYNSRGYMVAPKLSKFPFGFNLAPLRTRGGCGCGCGL